MAKPGLQMKGQRFFQTMLVAVLAFAGMAAGAQARLQVVVTTNIVADTVKNVVGDAADVISLMGPGVDPHLYNATQGDLRTLSRADVIFYNGLDLEGRMGNVLAQMGRSKPTFAVTEYMTTDELLLDPDWATADPHVWFDLPLWKKAVLRVRDAMSEVDPEHAAVYHENAARFLAEIDALHGWVEEQIASIPEERRVLVTAHDAFGYFGARYGIEVVGLQGLSTDTEYGLADVRNLVNLVIDRRIGAIFAETSVSSHGIQAVIEGARAQGHTVRIGGELFSDALDAPGTPGGTFLGMIRHNVSTIVAGLTSGL